MFHRSKTNHKHAMSAAKIKRKVSLCLQCSPIIKRITLCCWRSRSCCQSCCWRPQRWRWRWLLQQTGALRTCSSQTVQLLGSTPHQQLPWRQEQERGGTLRRYNWTVSKRGLNFSSLYFPLLPDFVARLLMMKKKIYVVETL